MFEDAFVIRLNVAAEALCQIGRYYIHSEENTPLAPLMDYLHTLEHVIGSMQTALGVITDDPPELLPFPPQ